MVNISLIDSTYMCYAMRFQKTACLCCFLLFLVNGVAHSSPCNFCRTDLSGLDSGQCTNCVETLRKILRVLNGEERDAPFSMQMGPPAELDMGGDIAADVDENYEQQEARDTLVTFFNDFPHKFDEKLIPHAIHMVEQLVTALSGSDQYCLFDEGSYGIVHEWRYRQPYFLSARISVEVYSATLSSMITGIQQLLQAPEIIQTPENIHERDWKAAFGKPRQPAGAGIHSSLVWINLGNSWVIANILTDDSVIALLWNFPNEDQQEALSCSGCYALLKFKDIENAKDAIAAKLTGLEIKNTGSLVSARLTPP